jgi:hypothetical protein
MLEFQSKPVSTPPAPPPLTDTSSLHPCSTGVKCGVQDGYVHLGSSPYATWTYGDNQCTAYTSLPTTLLATLLAPLTARLATPPSGSPCGPQRGLPCPPGRSPPRGPGGSPRGSQGPSRGCWPRGRVGASRVGACSGASCPVSLVGGGGTRDDRRRPGHRAGEVDGLAGVDGRCGWHGHTPMGPWG